MIEKSIVQYWNEDVLPDDIQLLADSWTHVNSADGYEHTVFSRESASEFLREEYGTELDYLFLNSRIPAMQSDIFRLAYCVARGGLYVDIGSRCNSPIDALFSNNSELTLMRKWHGAICNGLIISKPRAVGLELILEDVISNLRNRSHGSVWEVTGPANYIRIADREEHKERIATVDQLKICDLFELVGNEKRKGDEHWSNLEKTVDLYFDDDTHDQVNAC